MFLNISKTSKLIKDAYKTKLGIGNIQDGIIISSGLWTIWIENEHVPNKIKAVIMELAGEMPDENVVFEVNKEAPEPQVTEPEIYKSVLSSVEKARHKMIVTPVVLKQHREFRLLQNDEYNFEKAIVGLPEDQYMIIDKTVVDLDVEGEPTGPCNKGNHESPIYWHNSICTVIFMPVNLKQSELITALSNINFEAMEGKL
jgi:hypothetical protein